MMTSGSAVLKRSIDHKTYRNVCILLTLFVVALITRGGRIGDPAIHVDEEFYLLVADRMWQGALPYVDIWDRKPILLFLIYAALRPLSPDGIVAYQIGAMLFAVMTAFVVVLVAQRFANPRGAWLAGVTYLLYIPLLGGAGGQSPVFYNLLMAIGAWEAIRAGEADDAAGVHRHGLLSMLCAGLAIQVKYTAAIEGVAYGLWLIVLLRRLNCPSSRIALRAGLWIAVAIAPTLLATGFYVLTGHGPEFVQANFISIFQKHQPADFAAADFLWISGVKLAPLLCIAVFSTLLLLRLTPAEAPIFFLFLWTAFAIAGYFSIGSYYIHYALPLIVPMTILCAPLLGMPVGGVAAMALFGYAAILAMDFPLGSQRQQHERQIAAMVEAAQPYAARGCIYLHDGPMIVYLLTHSCLPTRYPFYTHLSEAAEAGATDATRNMAELLANRPSAIFVVNNAPILNPPNLTTAAMLDAALAKDYQRVATLPDVFASRQQTLYARKDLLPQETDR
jgi:hypothetical protein